MSEVIPISPASGDSPSADDKKPLDNRVIVAGVLGLVLLIAFGIWVARSAFDAAFGPAEPQPMDITINSGESLAAVVGYDAAIQVAEENGLPITAKLISPTLSADDARKLAGSATDVVRVRVQVMPGDRITMTADENGKHVPGTPIIYTPAPR